MKNRHHLRLLASGAVLSVLVTLGPVSSQTIFHSSLETEHRLFVDGFDWAPQLGQPIAAAGADRRVGVGDRQTLDGSQSSDPGGQPLAYRWDLLERPPGSVADVQYANTERPTFLPDLRGDYLLRLVVSNGELHSLPDLILVEAFDNFGVDSDGDGLGDALEVSLGLDPYRRYSQGGAVADGDLDLDADGLTILQELLLGLDPVNPDTDANGTLDGDEDPDLDGLTNRREFEVGTMPLRADTDEDDWPDGAEIDGNSDPLDPDSRPGYVVTMPGHTLTRPGVGDAGSGYVVTMPGHTLTRPGVGDAGSLPLNTVRADPPVLIERTQ